MEKKIVPLVAAVAIASAVSAQVQENIKVNKDKEVYSDGTLWVHDQEIDKPREINSHEGKITIMDSKYPRVLVTIKNPHQEIILPIPKHALTLAGDRGKAVQVSVDSPEQSGNERYGIIIRYKYISKSDKREDGFTVYELFKNESGKWEVEEYSTDNY